MPTSYSFGAGRTVAAPWAIAARLPPSFKSIDEVRVDQHAIRIFYGSEHFQLEARNLHNFPTAEGDVVEQQKIGMR